MWTVEISGKGWGVAKGPMDSKGGRAVRILGLLGTRLPTHHLWRKRGARGVRRRTGSSRRSASVGRGRPVPR